SSRRRHTRSYGDWSSDVCSSDLDNAPAVSPNGKWIAYTGFDDRLQGHQTTKLYLMNRDGTGSHSISEKLDRDIQGPQWAPDNSEIGRASCRERVGRGVSEVA